MARKSSSGSGEEFTLSPETYRKTVATMEELAFRGAKEESLVMRIANAAGLDEVAAHIKRMRIYAKKQGMVRQGRQPEDEGEESAPRTARKKKTARKEKAASSEGEGGAQGLQH